MASVRLAVAYALAQRYLAFALQLGTSIVMARLLTPEETGIYSLAAAAVAIGSVLREFGTGAYVISERDLTRDKLRAAHAVTIITAVSIAVVLAGLARPLAMFYKQPGVQSVLYLLSLNYLMLPLGSVANAVWHRELAFGKVLFVNTVSGVVGSAVTIGSALAHQSYLSPALGSIAGIAAMVACVAVMSPANVFMLPTTRGLRSVLRLGGTLTAARLIEQGGRSSIDFIVSATLGFHVTGLLSKANSLLDGFYNFFSSAMSQVATPALSRSSSSAADFQSDYARAVVLMALVQWMFFGLIAIFGAEVIEILFGPRWLDAVPAMQLGAIGGALSAPYMLYSSVMIARQEVGWQLRIPLLATPFLIACIWIGAQHSLEAVAAGAVVAVVFRLALISRALKASCGISSAPLFRALRPTLAVCAGGLLVALLSRWATLHWGWPAPLRLGVGVTLAVAATLAGAAWVSHPICGEMRRLGTHLRQRAA